MYRALCPRWHSTKDDIRHVVVSEGTSEAVVMVKARDQSARVTGSKSCDIQLLQKYHMIIEPKTSYPALTALTFHGHDRHCADPSPARSRVQDTIPALSPSTPVPAPPLAAAPSLPCPFPSSPNKQIRMMQASPRV